MLNCAGYNRCQVLSVESLLTALSYFCHSKTTIEIVCLNIDLYHSFTQTLYKSIKITLHTLFVRDNILFIQDVTLFLVDRHWLPIEAGIDYKITTLVYKCKYDLAPEYLSIYY